MSILDTIIEHKRSELSAARLSKSAEQMAVEAKACARPPLGFRDALRSTAGASVIAEIKRQSPSKGLIRGGCDAVEIAKAYADAGAACISVLTDQKFFGGSLDDLIRVRAAVETPLLRKDFVVDTYQIDEARVAGADAVLLIVTALDPESLEYLYDHAQRLGLDVLVEVHSDAEFDEALRIGANLIGINHRDLRTFNVDLGLTERIAARRLDPEIVLVAESGIENSDDVERLERAGATGFLVGESLMREPDPGQALKLLRRSS
jgi:indole-3-glycerol phosphate synthase